MKDWAKSRIKRIDFDVHFAPSNSKKAELNRILEIENQIFSWFSYLYMGRLIEGIAPDEDELGTARDVMRDIYQFAGRPLPGFFSDQPLEDTYDPGRKFWRDLFALHKASMKRGDNRLEVMLTEDMQRQDVLEAAGHLPQTVKHLVKGRTIVIESPPEFETWLHAGQNAQSNWRKRLWQTLSG